MTTVVIQPRRLARRHLWLVPGLAIGLYANAVAGGHDLGLLGLGALLAFGIVPHLTVLVGIGQLHAPGQLAPRAVPLFNALHHPVPPFVLLSLAALGMIPTIWFVGALAWLGHIVVDLGFGQGMRTADGWPRRWRGRR